LASSAFRGYYKVLARRASFTFEPQWSRPNTIRCSISLPWFVDWTWTTHITFILCLQISFQMTFEAQCRLFVQRRSYLSGQISNARLCWDVTLATPVGIHLVINSVCTCICSIPVDMLLRCQDGIVHTLANDLWSERSSFLCCKIWAVPFALSK